MEENLELDPILETIEAFLAETEITASELGVGAVNSSSLVPMIRSGRRLRERTRARVIAFIKAQLAAEAERDADAISIIKRTGFVYVDIDGEPCLETNQQISKMRFQRLLKHGMLIPNHDGLIDAISQTYVPS